MELSQGGKKPQNCYYFLVLLSILQNCSMTVYYFSLQNEEEKPWNWFSMGTTSRPHHMVAGEF